MSLNQYELIHIKEYMYILKEDPVKLGDPEEDVSGPDVGNPRGERWQQRRIASAQQIALYTIVCLDPDIPYNQYILIYSKEFMYDYFKHFVHEPIGYLTHSEFGDGKSWASPISWNIKQ